MKRKKSISGFPKITRLFVLILFFLFGNVVYNFILTSNERNKIESVSNLLIPYLNSLDEFKDLIVESKMYSTNWVYLPSNVDDKKRLEAIHSIRFPKVKEKLNDFHASISREESLNKLIEDTLFSVVNEFEKIILSQKKIMGNLRAFDEYEDPVKKFECEEIIESEIIPLTFILLNKLESNIEQNRAIANELVIEAEDDIGMISNIILIISILTSLLLFLAVYYISISINKPVMKMREIIFALSQGKLPETTLEVEENVIGEMAFAVNTLSINLLKTADFASQIEKGDFATQYNKLSDEDILGNSLIRMRDSLNSYSNHMEKKVRERAAEVTEKSIKIIEQKTFYDSIFSNIPIEISIFNEHHEYLFANKLAIPSDEIRNVVHQKSDFEFCSIMKFDPKIAERRKLYFHLTKQNRSPYDYEDFLINAAGQKVWKLYRFFPVFEEDNFRFMIFYGVDITNKKKYELEMMESLSEKEALLGEVHHRVKNNLALVMGLIELQNSKLTDESIKKEFSSIQHRISAMALIHEKLYKSSNFAKIELNDYLSDLINSLRNFYEKGKDIKLHFDLEKVLVTTKKAIPIALIVNELVTNCYKYAFIDSNKGDIFIKLHKIENNLELVISDSGNGIPSEFQPSESKSLGFKLLSIFVKQVKGTYQFSNIPGLEVKIKIPLEAETEEV